MVVNRFQTYATGYGDLTLGGAELEELKSPRVLGVTFDFKLTFDTHLRELVSMAARLDTYLIVHVYSRAVSMHMFCSI